MIRTIPVLFAVCGAVLVHWGGRGRSWAGDDLSAQREALSPSRVQALIDDLASGSRAERFQAEQALIDAGESVLELLPPSASVHQAAVREALARIRTRIAENAARSELRGRLVRTSNAESVADVLADLQRHTGNAVDVSLIDKRELAQAWNEDMGPATFFEVLDRVTTKLRTGWQWELSPRRIQILPSPRPQQPKTPVKYADAFRVELADVHRQDNRIDPRLRTLYRFLFYIDVEPRLKPFALYVIDADFQAVGDMLSLSLLNQHAKREPDPTGGRFVFPVDFAARIPEIPSNVDLSGKVSLRLAVRPVSVSFTEDDVSRPERRVGHMELKLEAWEMRQSRLTAVLRVTFDEPSPELESHRQGQLHRDIYLRSAAGGMFMPDDIRLTEDKRLTHVVQYVFDLGKAANADSDGKFTFVYVAPTLVTTVPLEFKFENIPLPRE